MTSKHPIVLLGLLFLSGCLPPKSPDKEPTGPISIPDASSRIQELRSDNGNSYRQTHRLAEQTFSSRWELGSALKRTSKLQLSQMPADWKLDQVKQAMQVVLDQRQSNPWYRKIEPVIFEKIDEAADSKSQAIGFSTDAPYRVAVKVQQRTNEWFVEVDVRIVNESGDNVGL